MSLTISWWRLEVARWRMVLFWGASWMQVASGVYGVCIIAPLSIALMNSRMSPCVVAI